jgi:hypothetical protein
LEALLILKEGEGLDEQVFSVPILFEDIEAQPEEKESETGLAFRNKS